jgi:hypothetical protein
MSQAFAIICFLSYIFSSMVAQESTQWLHNHPENEIHFRKKGEILGSVNWVHIRLDIDLGKIEQTIDHMCTVTSHHLGPNRTEHYDDYSHGYSHNQSFNTHIRLYDDMAFETIRTLHGLEEERCTLLRRDWTQLLTVWLRDDSILAAAASRARSPPKTQPQPSSRNVPFLEQMRLSPWTEPVTTTIPPIGLAPFAPPSPVPRGLWLRHYRNRINRLSPSSPTSPEEKERLEAYYNSISGLSATEYDASSWARTPPAKDPRSIWTTENPLLNGVDPSDVLIGQVADPAMDSTRLKRQATRPGESPRMTDWEPFVGDYFKTYAGKREIKNRANVLRQTDTFQHIHRKQQQQETYEQNPDLESIAEQQITSQVYIRSMEQAEWMRQRDLASKQRTQVPSEDKTPPKKMRARAKSSQQEFLKNLFQQANGQSKDEDEQERVERSTDWTSTLSPLLFLARPKRQVFILAMLIGAGIMALASTLFSQAQLAQISINSGTNQLAVKIMQDHETRLTVDRRTLDLLKENERELNTAVRNLYYNVIAMKTTLVNNEVEKEVRRIMTGIQLLSQHRLSPVLIETDQLAGILEDVTLAAENKMLSLATKTPEDIFRFETSHLIFRNMTLRIFVHLPAYRKNALMDLLEFVHVPMSIGKVPRFVLPNPEAAILAISRTQNMFRAMEKSSLAECSRVGELYTCRQDNLYDRRFHDSCLVSLYSTDNAGITRNCRFVVQPASDFLAQLNGTTFLLYQHDPAYVELACGDAREKAIFDGVRKVIVPPGCSVTTRSFVFDGAQSIFGDAVDVEQRVFSSVDIMTQSLLHQLGNISDENYARLAEMGSTKGLKIKDIVKEFADQTTTSIITIGLGTCLLVILSCICCILCLRARHFKKRMREEGRVFFSFGKAKIETGTGSAKPAAEQVPLRGARKKNQRRQLRSAASFPDDADESDEEERQSAV